MTDILGPASALNAVAARPSDGRQWGQGDTFFKDCSSPSMQDGTQVSAAWLNQVTGVLRTLARANGLKADGVTPVVPYDQSDNMPLNGIAQLVQRGGLNYAADSGTADALLATPATAVAEYRAGMRFLVLKNPTVGANASATPTINFGLGNLTVTKNDASALGIGDLKKGGIFEVELDGAGNARLTGLLAPSDVVASTTASVITLYVRTDGSDNNTGAANSPAGAFLTPSAAIAYGTGRFYLVGKTLLVQLGIPGTYPAPNNAAAGTASVTVRGDPANQNSYILQGAGVANQSLVGSTSGSFGLIGVTVQNTGTVSHATGAAAGAQLVMSYTTITTTVTTTLSQVVAAAAGTVLLGSGVTLSGNWGSALNASGGTISQTDVITVNGTPTYSNAFAVASNQGAVVAILNAGFTGSANGPKFFVGNNGLISAFGNVGFYPGSAAGTTDGNPGSLYVGYTGNPWTSFTPSVTATSGALGTVNTVCRYQRVGKLVSVCMGIGIGSVGSATGGLNVSLPFAPYSASAVGGSELSLNGKAITFRVSAGNAAGTIQYYDNSSVLATGATLIFNMTYEAAA